MTFNREMVTLLSLSGCPLPTTAGQATLVCFREATVRAGSARVDPQPRRSRAATSGRVCAWRAWRPLARPFGSAVLGRPWPRGVRRRGLPNGPRRCQGRAAGAATPEPRAPSGGRDLNSALRGASVPPWTPKDGAGAATGSRPGLLLCRGLGKDRSSMALTPPPRGPPGGAPASSPDRTWLLAPRLPCPARSPRAGRRRGSCCGPGCSTPPLWGCGMGSCRSLLGRRRRRQAGGPKRAPPPETRPEPVTSEP